MRVCTWNVNSVRLRVDQVRRLVTAARPDVICLQETKVSDHLFPLAPFTEQGFTHHLVHGMKSHNGVAILSRLPLEGGGVMSWCGREDCRHLHAMLPGGIELHNLYVPSGGDVPDAQVNDRFAHKLAFLDAVTNWLGRRRKAGRRMILAGDLNIAPLDTDVWSHKQLIRVVSHTPVEVERFAALMASLDWVDAVRHFVPATERLYSWWSYRARDWRASNRGRRLDHVLVTPPLVDRLRRAAILKDARDWHPPSDHVPVVVELEG